MPKNTEIIVPLEREDRKGGFWRRVAAGGIRGGAVLISAVLFYGGAALSDGTLTDLIANEIYPIEISSILGVGAGLTARRILHN